MTQQVVYVARNPKDVAVSYYHLHRLMKNLDFKGNFEEFWNYFKNDLGNITFGAMCFGKYLTIFSHLVSLLVARERRMGKKDEDNLLFLFYENINKVNE